MRTAHIGLLGLGHVGSAVASALDQHRSAFAQRTGVVPVLTRIAVKHLGKPRQVVVDPNLLTDDAWTVVHDPRVDVVIEAIGGISPAGAFVEEALRNGKSVVTANKQLVGLRGREFELLAASTKHIFAYEASVGGAVPVIRLLKESLRGDRVTSLMAIINGTANYILTQMEEGISFEDAQAAAQALGLAEPDPSDDLDGHDAAAKLAIVASLAFDTSIQPDQIAHQGIRHISPADIEQAKAGGAVVRLLAVARRDGHRIEAGVFPSFLPLSHPFAQIRNEQNGVLLQTDLAGELFIHGLGAGGRPTASAILADLAAAVEHGAIRRSVSTSQVIPIVPPDWATIPKHDHIALNLISSNLPRAGTS